MIVAELRIVPVGEGSSMKEAVEKATHVLKAHEVNAKVGAMGTTLEAQSLALILSAVREAHEAAVAVSPRVVTELSIDQRTDKEETVKTLAKVR